MRNLFRWSVAAVVGLTFSAACGGGGGDGGTGPSGGNATITAKIDGVAWSADADRIQILPGSTGVPGSLLVIATSVSGNSSTTIQFILGYVKFQAIYPLGVNYITTPGGTGSITEQAGATSEFRMTPLDGASGALQLVTRTGNHVKGTFSFVAQPVAGQQVTGNRTITEGTFEFDLPQAFTDLDNVNFGSDVQANFDGAHYYAATTLALGGNGFAVITGQTNSMSLQISNTTAVNGPATLNLLNGVKITLIDLVSGHSWGGISGDVGQVQYSGFGARANGTFSGTLQPNFQGGSAVTITGGSFNVRVDAP